MEDETDEVMVQNMSPELIEQLIELGIIPGQIDQTQADILRGQELQDSPTPQGRSFRDGIYQAASPLEHIGNYMQRMKGQGQETDARGMADQLRGQQTAGRRKFFDAWQNRGTPQVPMRNAGSNLTNPGNAAPQGGGPMGPATPIPVQSGNSLRAPTPMTEEDSYASYLRSM